MAGELPQSCGSAAPVPLAARARMRLGRLCLCCLCAPCSSSRATGRSQQARAASCAWFGPRIQRHGLRLFLLLLWKIGASCVMRDQGFNASLPTTMCCYVRHRTDMQCLRLLSFLKRCVSNMVLQRRVWCKRSSSSIKSTGNWLASKCGGTFCHRRRQERAQGPLPLICMAPLEHKKSARFGAESADAITMSCCKQNLYCRYWYFFHHARRCWPGCMRSPLVRRRGS